MFFTIVRPTRQALKSRIFRFSQSPRYPCPAEQTQADSGGSQFCSKRLRKIFEKVFACTFKKEQEVVNLYTLCMIPWRSEVRKCTFVLDISELKKETSAAYSLPRLCSIKRRPFTFWLRATEKITGRPAGHFCQ